jgi:hypothetical protein
MGEILDLGGGGGPLGDTVHAAQPDSVQDPGTRGAGAPEASILDIMIEETRQGGLLSGPDGIIYKNEGWLDRLPKDDANFFNPDNDEMRAAEIAEYAQGIGIHDPANFIEFIGWMARSMPGLDRVKGGSMVEKLHGMMVASRARETRPPRRGR